MARDLHIYVIRSRDTDADYDQLNNHLVSWVKKKSARITSCYEKPLSCTAETMRARREEGRSSAEVIVIFEAPRPGCHELQYDQVAGQELQKLKPYIRGKLLLLLCARKNLDATNQDFPEATVFAAPWLEVGENEQEQAWEEIAKLITAKIASMSESAVSRAVRGARSYVARVPRQRPQAATQRCSSVRQHLLVACATVAAMGVLAKQDCVPSVPEYNLVVSEQTSYLVSGSASSAQRQTAGTILLCPGDALDVKLVPSETYLGLVGAVVRRSGSELPISFHHDKKTGTLRLRGKDIFELLPGESTDIQIELVARSELGLLLSKQTFLLSVEQKMNCPAK